MELMNLLIHYFSIVENLTNQSGMKLLSLLFVLCLPILVAAQLHVVTNLGDSGPGTLREAVINSNSGDTIRFHPNLLANGSDTINLNFPISFVNGVTIQGLINGSDTLYISGQDSTQIFYINLSGTSSDRVVLKDLVLVNGRNNQHGGAMFAEGVDSLVIQNCIFRGNKTIGDYYGGGIFISNTNFRIENTRFESNSTDTTLINATWRFGGGAYFTSSNGMIRSSVYTNNYSLVGGGGMYFTLGDLLCEGVRFERNSTYPIPLTGSIGAGLSISSSSFKIQNSVFLSNTNNGSSAALEAQGGALRASNCATQAMIRSCIFQDNYCVGSGGALMSLNSSTIVSNSTFLNNTAIYGGALSVLYGSLTLAASTLQNNHASAFGGAISVPNADTVSIVNSSLVSGNSSSADYAFRNMDLCDIRSSILYSNQASPVVQGGTVFDSEFNIYSWNPSFASSTDQTNIDSAILALEPLAMNGGLTPTMLPGPTSVALNTGDPTDFSDAQNGPIFGRRDVGAAERAVILYDTTLACSPVNWWGNTYNTAGTYTDTAYNANSIDSVGVLVLELQDTGVMNINGVLVALEDDPNTTYQWVDCDNSFTPVSGAVDSSFLPPSNGNYAVILTNGSCSDTSACVLYEEFRIEEGRSTDNWITFYPNPTTGTIYLRPDGKLPIHLEVFDLTGRKVSGIPVQSASLQLPLMSPGTYLLKWTGEDGSVQVDRVVVR